MFRLLKLGVYALIGYVIYEMYLGIKSGSDTGRQSLGGGQQRARARGGARRGRRAGSQNISGPGEGVDVNVEDSGGGMARHTVGRGVTE